MSQGPTLEEGRRVLPWAPGWQLDHGTSDFCLQNREAECFVWTPVLELFQ